MQTTARLIRTRVPRSPTAAVVVLHGGGGRGGAMPVSPTQLSVVRMIPIAHRVAHVGRGRLAVWRLLNSVRGWDGAHTPVDDVRWALRQLRDQLPPSTPIGLIGHSLGGRAAILASGEANVRSVVALAPWIHPRDGDVDASGRRILFVHGSDDRVASPQRALAAADRLSRTAQVGVIRVAHGGHAMVRRHGTFDGLAAGFTAATLLDEAPDDSHSALARVLAGASSVTT
ncbi:alpha/beta hydrolase [Amycolatopsis coloradensis]|uniref:Alpha/beta hydrolase n=1 Tax=Amycolatopsis coloradensis TaxID=76021 RepID=A0A1R0KUU6_9PSEU|nr:alpha/beta hydrolase [Amycolatopsis coloradensis]OLZ52356.1 alpha/beta hydrolase [Amycolatopsis coloradensis]